MNNTTTHLPEIELPETVKRFVTLRKKRGGVSAVLLYGSYARGTQHEHSDVDIIFVVDKGFKSEFVVYEDLDFEVLEATKSSMITYWQKNWDEDRHWYLWKDVKVIYDRDGEGVSIVKHAISLVGERLPWQRERIEMRRQIMLAKLRKIRHLSQRDQGTAAMLLIELVRAITEHWFSIRGQFVPSTKEFHSILASECPEFGNLIRDFHLNSAEQTAKLNQVENMLAIVYL